MNNLNATTPQLKCVDRFYEAYTTCDINKVAPLLSKNYMYELHVQVVPQDPRTARSDEGGTHQRVWTIVCEVGQT